MRVMELPGTRWPAVGAAAFTLAEVVISVGIMMLVFAAIITAYVQSSYRAEWTGFSLAAQASGVQQLESVRSAVWDPLQNPLKDEIAQVPINTTVLMDLPITGTNTVCATNYLTVTLVQNGVYSNYFVRVDTVWPFRWGQQIVYFTNTIADYYAPD